MNKIYALFAYISIIFLTSCSISQNPQTDLEKAEQFSQVTLDIVKEVMDAKDVAVNINTLEPAYKKAIAALKAVEVPKLENKKCQEMARTGVLDLISAYEKYVEVITFMQMYESGEIIANATSFMQLTAIEKNPEEADELVLSGMNKTGAMGVIYCLKQE